MVTTAVDKITAWIDGSRGTAKQNVAGLKPRWGIQKVTGVMWWRI